MLGQAVENQAFDGRRREVGQAQLRERRRRRLGVRPHQPVHRRGLERPPARQHFVQKDADAVEVAPAVHLVAAHLLRGDVLRRARGRRQRVIEQLVRRDVQERRHLGQAEVHQLQLLDRRAGVDNHQVARLDVAVDDAGVVGRLKDAAQLRQQPAGALRREALLPVQQLIQIDAAQVLQHQHGAVRRLGVGVEEGHGVRVLEARRDVDLAPEVFANRGLGQVRFLQDLDDDFPIRASSAGRGRYGSCLPRPADGSSCTCSGRRGPPCAPRNPACRGTGKNGTQL